MVERGIDVTSQSRLYRSPAFPPGAGPDYVNAVVGIETTLAPDAVLTVLHGIERDSGRVRRERWAARILDLDLLALGDHILPDPAGFARWRDMPLEEQTRHAPDYPVLPHPRMQDRAFVLKPLAEIAPEWRHPVTGVTVSEMLNRLPMSERRAVVPVDEAA